MSNIFDEYSRKARLFPAFLCSIPFILMKHIIVDPFVGMTISDWFWTVMIEDASLAVVLTYMLTQIIRMVSKALFEDKTNFATTIMLLPSSVILSADYKRKIADKVLADFQIGLPSLQDEQADLSASKARIREVVSLIIHKVANGRLLLQHNIEYGFARNLIGGSVIGLLASIICMVIFRFFEPNHVAFIISIFLTTFYLIPILFSKAILSHFSKEYAQILFREYIGG